DHDEIGVALDDNLIGLRHVGDLPTAAVLIFASSVMRLAKGTWKPLPTGTLASGTSAPDDTSIRSMPSSFARRANSIDCSISQPPLTQSVAEMRMKTGSPRGTRALTVSATRKGSRMRFSRLPP